jgi:putative sigma-54 modulation protein
MKIEVRFRAIEGSETFREHVVRRARFQLSRFNDQVGSVIIRVGDINGPKGGADKRCQVTLRGPALGAIAVETLSSDAYSAVDLALARATRTIGRGLERARVSRRPERVVRRAS